MTTVRNTVVDAAGGPVAGVTVSIELDSGGQPAYLGGNAVEREVANITTDNAGVWSKDLPPNAGILPDGTTYVVTEKLRSGAVRLTRHRISVPTAGGPYDVVDLIVDPPKALPTPALSAHVNKTTGAHRASAISVVPTGSVAATNVQDAIAELASEGGSTLAAETAARTAADAAETAARAAGDALLIPLAQKAAANGVATLDAGGLVPTSQIPPLAIVQPYVVASQAAMLALAAQRGDVAVRTDNGRTYILATDSPTTLADWKEITHPDAVTTVAGKTGAVALVEADVANLVADLAAKVAAGTMTFARTSVKTAGYTAAAGELVPVDTTAGPVTITLPTAPANKTVVAVKLIIQGGTNAVTVNCAGADVFNRAGGATSGTLSLPAQAFVLEYDAASAIWTVLADDLPLSSLDARFAALGAAGVTLGPANGTNDTAAMNAVLAANAGKVVRGVPGSTYKINAPLVIYGGTTLDLTGCTVQLLAASSCNMINNYGVSSGARDANIAVIGGTWDRGANGGAGVAQHSLRFRKCDGLTVADIRVTSTGGKFAINVGDCTAFTVERINLSVASDGVHLDGPCARGLIRDIHGTTTDDFVALTPRDWSSVDDTGGGDITDITISDLFPNGCASAVKVLGGSVGAARRITVRNVYGSCSSGSSGGVWIGDDAGQANTTGGLVDLVRVENVHVTVANATPQVLINGTNIGRVEVNGLFFDNSASTTSPVVIAPGAAATIRSIVLRNIHVTTLGTRMVVETNANATPTTLVIDGVTVQQFSSSNTSSMVASIAGAITNLTVRNVHIGTCTGGYVVNIAAAITRLLVDRVSFTSSSGNSYVVAVQAATIADLVIRGVTATMNNGYALLLNAATSAVTRTSMTDMHLVGTSGGGGLISAGTSTHTLPNVELAACVINTFAWVADLNTTTEIHMVGVLQTGGGGSLNIRANANVTLRGAGCLVGNVTNAGTFTNRSIDFAGNIPANVVLDTTTGTKLGTGTTQKLGFWNATPIAQPARAGQLTDNTGGTGGGSTVAAVAASTTDADAAKLADTRNALATVIARLNSLEAKLSAAGGGSGLTA